MEPSTAIKVDNVSKVFKLPHEKSSSIKSAVVNFYRPHKKGYELQQALKDVSFEVKKGEFFGIVGRNGSGKSTLLKLLAGIYQPSNGSIGISGSLTPFIELGVGFNAELTGRENVYLNGALLGFNRKEMASMYKGIVDFAELKKFMDQKLKNYSSGMQVRLAFSIAIRAKSDILLLDEVLAVGDAAFQKKCFDYFRQLKKDGQTVVLVSHDMDTVEKYCDRAMLIEQGVLIETGEPREVAAKYRLMNIPKEKDSKSGAQLSKSVSIDRVTINGTKEVRVKENDQLSVEVVFTPKRTQNYIVSISIFRSDGYHLAYYDNRQISKGIDFKAGKAHKTLCKLPAEQFMGGAYLIDVDIYNDDDVYLAHKGSAVQFAILTNRTNKAGPLNIQGQWQVDAKKA